jgi:hypothetical protein
MNEPRSSTTLAGIAGRLGAHRLEVLGGFACGGDAGPEAGPEAGLPAGTRTLLLIGPGPGFWPHVRQAADWGAADPLDRWSRQVIGRLACDLGGKALFPFGGPPHHPFHAWALRSGRIWESPVRLLVHDRQGLWVSFRGALALRQPLALPPAGTRPCGGCPAPCLTACPPGALTAAGYDVPACRTFLDSGPGADCLQAGCRVRRACPVSQGYDRMPEQSAYHMARFHPGART